MKDSIRFPDSDLQRLDFLDGHGTVGSLRYNEVELTSNPSKQTPWASLPENQGFQKSLIAQSALTGIEYVLIIGKFPCSILNDCPIDHKYKVMHCGNVVS